MIDPHQMDNLVHEEPEAEEEASGHYGQEVLKYPPYDDELYPLVDDRLTDLCSPDDVDEALRPLCVLNLPKFLRNTLTKAPAVLVNGQLVIVIARKTTKTL